MARIDSLLDTMTLEEKIGQLSMAAGSAAVTGPGERQALEQGVRGGRTGSVLNLWGADPVHALQRLAVEESRLRIPLLFGLDVLHGHRTIFPIPLAEAGLFDTQAWERSASAAAAEAAADGIHLTFAPMLDVARDARWGRMGESPGEDAYLASQFAAAKTRGFQQGDLRAACTIAATAKHLCGYGAVTAGREYAPVDTAPRTLRETYLPPFAASVAAGVAAIMPALTDIAGVPMTASEELLSDWLRSQQGFEGVVISDYNAIAELINHGVAADLAQAAALALRAGVDIDMASNAYSKGLPEALRRGLISSVQLDRTVRRVLRLKERLGLFEDPYRRGSGPAPPRCRTLARELARRSIVLLTHRQPVLPLAAGMRRLTLLGPLADAAGQMLGPWASAGTAQETVSFRAGLEAALPGCRVECHVGTGPGGEADLRAVSDLCGAAEAIILCLGESASMSGEAASRSDLGLPDAQLAIAEAALVSGKPVIALLSSGRPLTVPWLFERAHAVLATWFLGSEAGNAVADVLTGRCNPSGKLAVSWPRAVGQVPIFHGQRPSGRPPRRGERFSSSYLDVPFSPQFCFGHGLSYSRFALHELNCSPLAVRRGESFEVAVQVENCSATAGEVTVFLFMRDVVASIAQPTLSLKGWQRLALGPRERGALRWSVPVDALRFIGKELEAVLEPGRFEIHVGQSAEPDELLSCAIELLE
jgi:beta-glucosidase